MHHPANFAGYVFRVARLQSRTLTLREKADSTEPICRKVVWPDKCNCTGVHVAPIVELLNAAPAVTRPPSFAQGSDQLPQTFKESLLAASRAFSDARGVHEVGARTGRRQNSASDDTRSAHATFHSGVGLLPDPPQQTLQQLAPPAQQIIDPATVVPMQLPPGRAEDAPKAASLAVTPAGDGAAPKFPATGSSITPPVVAKPDDIPSGDTREQIDPSQVAPTLPSVGYGSQVAAKISAAVTIATSSAPANTPNPPSNTIPNDTAAAAPSIVPDALRTLVPVIVSGAAQGDVRSAASGPSALQQPDPKATPTVVPGIPAKAISDTVAKASPDPAPHVAPTEVPPAIRNSTSSPSANVSSDAPPTPISHDHAAKGEVAEKSNSVSANQVGTAAPQPTPDEPALVPNAPAATAGQLAALIQPASAQLVTAPVHALELSAAGLKKFSDLAGADRKDGLSSAIHDLIGLKQHAPSESAPAQSQPVSQDTSPSGDQSQDGASQQGQNAATTQVNFLNHNGAAVDHAQNLGTAVLSQTAPAPAAVSGHTVTAPQTAAAPTVAVPQAVPVINTARLIQSMGQSEMRVGMHSNDFGNISISTSATRDLISARISLEHGELARTLATHLPEMQAKFGANQAMNVRIDTNGQPAGQSARNIHQHVEWVGRPVTQRPAAKRRWPFETIRRRFCRGVEFNSSGGVAAGREQARRSSRHQGLVRISAVSTEENQSCIKCQRTILCRRF